MPVCCSGHKNVVSSCDFSENERHLCTSSWDKTLQIWDISTGMFRYAWHDWSSVFKSGTLAIEVFLSLVFVMSQEFPVTTRTLFFCS